MEKSVVVSLSKLPHEPPWSPGQNVGVPEPAASPPQAADDIEMPLPSSPQTFFLGSLLTLAVLAAIHVASSIILPVVLAFVLQLILHPVVHLLERIGLPRAIGALLAILVVVGALVGFVAALSLPAASWAEKLPEGLPRLETHLVVLKRPIEALQKVIQQAEHVADAPEKKGATVSVRSDLGLTGALFAGTRAVIDGLFTTVLVLYFLLVAGDVFLRRIVEVLPSFRDKRQAVDISQQIEADISAYLLTITTMNAAVGAATAVAMYFCGLGDPLLWGAAAFLLNYVPILGPLLGTVIFLLAGMLSFDSLWWALLPPALYFCIHLAEGETLTPMLLARRFTLNPVLVILSLVFWFWMWGVPGAILAVPMLAILKIVSDRVRPLRALGHVLEG
ncbi:MULTISPECIES: AI-2E family transporter [Bradyrhizobium]|uniref:AI-2E family transporter n=3 Tax=Bradyrhizobium TaxID=374 RepID=A0A4Q1VD40_9BRAD|nr:MULTISPECIES: AI-2E family transporter [Bradyrhizobium]MBR1293272.1 AI-2E family transporter [Bradyrhizobium ottawaense]MBR1361541.1 AI-2E family transporter [Bradyrhizobium ottawaense]MDA9487027.1 transporter [Bradyrhizobium sp. CCBAU 11445]PDT64919.1 AI-2E family transporter [Bradyrhizobium ottawaense]RXT49183.1 AI-2E family transporter [Bradyrhizobium betae]